MIRGKNYIEDIRQIKVEGAMMRSKYVGWTRGKLTKLFIHLKKRNYVDKTILHLQNPKGDLITEQENIKNETLRFYSNLYDYECKDSKLNLNDFEFENYLSKTDLPE